MRESVLIQSRGSATPVRSSGVRLLFLGAAVCAVLACTGAKSIGFSPRCGIGELREGGLPGSPNLRLGKPIAFDDGVGIDAGLCARLSDGSQFVTWVHAYHQVDSRLFVQRCETIEPSEPTDPGSVSGAVSEDYVELVFKGAQPEFRALPAPMWSGFSNPSFCRSHMAYWGTEFPDNQPTEVHAVVYDLIGNRVVEDKVLGRMHLESDSRNFFERPRWSADAGKVFFQGRGDVVGTPVPLIGSHQFDLEEPGH